MTSTSHGPEPWSPTDRRRSRRGQCTSARRHVDRRASATAATDCGARRRARRPASRASSDTRAPRARQQRAVASPMPLEPPVITTCAPPRVGHAADPATAGPTGSVQGAPTPRCSGPVRSLLAVAALTVSTLAPERRRRPAAPPTFTVQGERRPGRGDRRRPGADRRARTPRARRRRPAAPTRSAATLFRDVPPGPGYVVSVDGTTRRGDRHSLPPTPRRSRSTPTSSSTAATAT